MKQGTMSLNLRTGSSQRLSSSLFNSEDKVARISHQLSEIEASSSRFKRKGFDANSLEEIIDEFEQKLYSLSSSNVSRGQELEKQLESVRAQYQEAKEMRAIKIESQACIINEIEAKSNSFLSKIEKEESASMARIQTLLDSRIYELKGLIQAEEEETNLDYERALETSIVASST